MEKNWGDMLCATLIIMLTWTYVSLFLHTTERGTDFKDNEFLEVALQIIIRIYILAVSMNICDVIAVPSIFFIRIRQCSQQSS